MRLSDAVVDGPVLELLKKCELHRQFYEKALGSICSMIFGPSHGFIAVRQAIGAIRWE